MLTRTPPEAARLKPIGKSQFDVDNTLVGNTSQLGMGVQAVHVVLLLGFGNSTHLIFGPALVAQLQYHSCQSRKQEEKAMERLEEYPSFHIARGCQ